MKISNSKIKTWRSCKMKYNYKYVEKLRPRKKASPLVRGTIIHSMLEANIGGKDPLKVWEEAKKTYAHMFREEREVYDQMMEDIRLLMTSYFQYYEDDPLTYVEHKGKKTEYYFEVDLTPAIQLIGYIDSVATKDGLNWLVEHKSHKEIPKGDLKYSDIQGALYAYAMPLTGLPKPDGVCWDYIRMKSPTIPELLKNGQLSKKANIDTLWPVYREQIRKNGLKLSDYKDMKELLQRKYDDFFIRKYLPLNKTILKNLVEDAVTTAREIKRKAGKDKTRNIEKHCEWCDYYNLCQADLRGLDTKFIKKTNFEVRNEDDKTKEQHNG